MRRKINTIITGLSFLILYPFLFSTLTGDATLIFIFVSCVIRGKLTTLLHLELQELYGVQNGFKSRHYFEKAALSRQGKKRFHKSYFPL